MVEVRGWALGHLKWTAPTGRPAADSVRPEDAPSTGPVQEARHGRHFPLLGASRGAGFRQEGTE